MAELEIKHTTIEGNLGRALQALTDSDPLLARLIKRVGACRMELHSHASPFEALLSSICHQQLHGKAAKTIHARVYAAFSEHGVLRPERILAAEHKQLLATGLSRQKTAAICDLAARTCDGTVPSLDEIRLLSNEEIIARLTAVRGVGLWTVQMFLMFVLGRPDVLPAGDFGIRKGFARTFRLREFPAPQQVAERGSLWAPWRTVASWYLWRAAGFPGPRVPLAKAKRKGLAKVEAAKKAARTKIVATAKKTAASKKLTTAKEPVAVRPKRLKKPKLAAAGGQWRG
jgi:DNA-3-methyladenine glycosylase II